MDKPLSVLAILIGVVAISIAMTRHAPTSGDVRTEAAARADVLSRDVGRIERGSQELETAVEGLSKGVEGVSKGLAGVSDPGVSDADISRLCDEALRKREVPLDEGRGPEGAAPKDAAAPAVAPAVAPPPAIPPPPQADGGGAGTPIERLKQARLDALGKLGITGEKAAKVAELLESERMKLMDAIAKHRGDREGFEKARGEILAATDGEAKKVLAAGEFEAYAGWRRSPEGRALGARP
jgi:hypothetical protein